MTDFSPSREDGDGQKLIRHATLSFTVNNVKSTYDSIQHLIKKFNAYSSKENLNDNGDDLEQSLAIRVDEKYFDQMLEQIEQLAKNVERKDISIQDVTSEFTDHEVRLRTKKEMEKRYYEILHQAKTVKDMLDIEEQLGTVREDIESMEARLKYLSNQVAYSTINIKFSEKRMTESGFLSKTVVSLKEGWERVLSIALTIISLWPMILFLLGSFMLIMKFRRNRKIRRESLA